MIGGAGDIGAAISNLFCDLGATVTATAVDEAAISRSQTSSARRAQPFGRSTSPMTRRSRLSRKSIKRVDALINCAGILARDKEYEIATFMKVLDVNLTGTFRTCMAFRAALAQSKGSIVNIASMNATLALPRIPAYCASKGGVVMLTKALALAWAAEGIRVNAVAPGYIETSINEAGRQDRGALPAHRRPHRLQALGPAGRCRRRGGVPVHAGIALRHRNCRRRRWRIPGRLNSNDHVLRGD